MSKNEGGFKKEKNLVLRYILDTSVFFPLHIYYIYMRVCVGQHAPSPSHSVGHLQETHKKAEKNV